jgi:hypothetical protein
VPQNEEEIFAYLDKRGEHEVRLHLENKRFQPGWYNTVVKWLAGTSFVRRLQ